MSDDKPTPEELAEYGDPAQNATDPGGRIDPEIEQDPSVAYEDLEEAAGDGQSDA